LYDTNQHVSGFVELRTDSGCTAVKIRHNLSQGSSLPVQETLQARELLLSVDAQCAFSRNSHVLNVNENNQTLQIPEVIDLSREVVICLMGKEGNKVSTLASGAINLTKNASIEEKQIQASAENLTDSPNLLVNSSDTTPLSVVLDETEHLPIGRKYKTEAAREIDEMLRAVCTVDEKGKGQCETCPYREHFFGENIDLTIGNNSNIIKHG